MRTWISRRLRPLLAASAVAGLAWAGWSQRDAIASFDWSIDRGLLALAIALFAVAPLLQGLTFALGLRRIGAGGQAGASSDVQNAQRCAPIGIALRHSGQSRVFDSTSGSVRRRAMR